MQLFRQHTGKHHPSAQKNGGRLGSPFNVKCYLAPASIFICADASSLVSSLRALIRSCRSVSSSALRSINSRRYDFCLSVAGWLSSPCTALYASPSCSWVPSSRITSSDLQALLIADIKLPFKQL